MTVDYAKLVFTADDRTREAFGSIQRNMAEFQGAASRLASILPALGVGISAAGFSAFVKSSIDAADEMNKLSQKVGLSVESLSALKYAGDLSDVSVEQLGTGLKQLSRNMLDAAAGTGEAKDAFAALGIDVRGLSNEQVLSKIADQFAQMEDGAGKTALAMKVFGKSGADLIPLLNQGSAGLSDLRKEAERLGVVMSSQMARAAEEFNDNLTRMRTHITGIGYSLANDVLGPLGAVASEMGNTSNKANELTSSINPLKTVLEAVIITGANVKFVFEGIGREIGAISAQAAALARGSLSEAQAIRRELIADNQEARKQLDLFEQKVLHPDLHPTVAQMLAQQEAGFAKASAPALPAASSGSGKMQGPIDVFDNGSYITRDKATADFIRNQFKDSNALDNEAVKERADAAKKAADAMESLRVKYVDLIDPVQKYRDQLDEIDKLEEAGKLSADQAAEARFKINEAIDATMKFGDSLKQANSDAKEFGLQINSAFERAVLSGGKVSDMLKSIGQDFAALIYKKTVGKSLESITGNIADSIGTLFSFAEGGIMTPAGPLPLRKYATGGIADSPQLALYGEGSMNEAIVPLPDGRAIPVKMKGGGGISIQQTIQIDARGADTGVEQRIRTAMKETQESTINRIMDLNQRGALKLS